MRFSGYRTRDDIMGTTLAVNSKMIAHCTVEYTTKNGEMIIRYQDTDIVTIKPNRHMILNSGGYRTPTTKNRINDHIGTRGSVYQENSIWYYKPGQWRDPRKPAIFVDGITLNTRGTVISKTPKPDLVLLATKKMKKKINAFVATIDKLDSLPLPTSGDCWYCSMQTTDTNEPLGDATNNTEHLKSHVFENYLHGSLLVNAMRSAGYEDQQIGIHYQMQWKDTFKRALRRYLNSKLLK